MTGMQELWMKSVMIYNDFINMIEVMMIMMMMMIFSFKTECLSCKLNDITSFLLIIFHSIAVSIIEERERWRRESGFGYATKDIPDKPGNIKLHRVTMATQTNILTRSGSYILN